MPDERTLNFRVWQKAGASTLRFAKRHVWGGGIVLGLWVAGSLIYGSIKGWPAVMDEFWIFSSYTILPVFGFLVTLFLWNLWLAPTRIMLTEIESVKTATRGSGQPQSALAMVDFEPPNYAAWRLDEYSVVDAAFLWVGETPKTSNMLHGDALGRFKMLQSAIRRGDLPAYVPQPDGEYFQTNDVREVTVVRYDELLEFAEKRGEQPQFLQR